MSHVRTPQPLRRDERSASADGNAGQRPNVRGENGAHGGAAGHVLAHAELLDRNAVSDDDHSVRVTRSPPPPKHTHAYTRAPVLSQNAPARQLADDERREAGRGVALRVPKSQRAEDRHARLRNHSYLVGVVLDDHALRRMRIVRQ
jgi:hypothetical protein